MMKKTLFAAALISSVLANAQDTSTDPTLVKNRRGQEVLPKAGDIALGFNAVPVIDFLVQSVKVGAVSGTSAGTTSQFTQNAGQQIVGKYFFIQEQLSGLVLALTVLEPHKLIWFRILKRFMKLL